MSQVMGGSVPIRRGAAAGAAAFVAVAVIIHVILRTGTFVNRFMAQGVSQSPITLTVGALLDAHAWFIQMQVLDSPIPTLVPLVALLAAGAYTARSSGARSPVDGFKSGMTVVAGYLALLIVAIVVMRVAGAGGGGGTSTNQIIQVAITGLVYPLVVGGLGGVLAGFALDTQVGAAST